MSIQNKDLTMIFANAKLITSMLNIPFKITRAVNELAKVVEKSIEKQQEIKKLGEEKKAKPEEIEAEINEYLEQEAVGVVVVPISFFDEIPNETIGYKTFDESGKKEEQKYANSHACISYLIEKGFAV